MNSSVKWLFFGLSFVVSLMEFGLVFSFGALFSAMLDTFNTDRPTAATVQSLLIGVTSCFSAASGILIHKFGLPIVTLVSSIFVSTGFAVSFLSTDIRHLYASISILAGVGISMIFVSSLTLISTIFGGKQRSLCIAIYSTGVPLAGIIYPYLLDLLSSNYGLGGTFLILGGIFCNAFVFSLMLWLRRCELEPKMENAQEEIAIQRELHKNEIKSNRNVLKFFKQLISKRYICLLVAAGLALSTLNGYLDLVFDIASWKEYDESQAKMFFVIYNVLGCICSVIPGLLKMKRDTDTYLNAFLFALFGFSGCLMIYFSNSFTMYAFGTACVGAGPGIISSSFIICVQLVHLEQAGVAIGLIQTIIGLLSAGFGPLFGAIRDSSDSYNLVFIIICAAQAMAAALFAADIIQRRLNRNTVIDIIEIHK